MLNNNNYCMHDKNALLNNPKSPAYVVCSYYRIEYPEYPQFA